MVTFGTLLLTLSLFFPSFLFFPVKAIEYVEKGETGEGSACRLSHQVVCSLGHGDDSVLSLWEQERLQSNRCSLWRGKINKTLQP